MSKTTKTQKEVSLDDVLEQQQLDSVVKVKANKSEVEIPEYEQGLVHVTLEDVKFDSKTGERISSPLHQKFDVTTFLRMEEYKAFGDQEVVLLHQPEALTKAYAIQKGAKK
jgi:hypothetical protein